MTQQQSRLNCSRNYSCNCSCNSSRIVRWLRVANQPMALVMALMLLVISVSGCGGSDKNYKIPVDAPKLKPFEPPATEEFDADDSDWSEDDADDDDADDDDDANSTGSPTTSTTTVAQPDPPKAK